MNIQAVEEKYRLLTTLREIGLTEEQIANFIVPFVSSGYKMGGKFSIVYDGRTIYSVSNEEEYARSYPYIANHGDVRFVLNGMSDIEQYIATRDGMELKKFILARIEGKYKEQNKANLRFVSYA